MSGRASARRVAAASLALAAALAALLAVAWDVPAPAEVPAARSVSLPEAERCLARRAAVHRAGPAALAVRLPSGRRAVVRFHDDAAAARRAAEAAGRVWADRLELPPPPADRAERRLLGSCLLR